MNITMYEYRKMLKKAAKAMSVDVTTRLTTDEIMNLCGHLDPEPDRNYHSQILCTQIVL